MKTIHHTGFDVSSPRTHRWGGVGIVVVISLVAGLALPFLLQSLYVLAVVLVVLNTALVILPFVRLIRAGQTVVQPIVIFSLTAAGYALGAVYLLSGRQSQTLDYLLTPANLSYFTFALFVVLLGTASYQLAYYVSLGVREIPQEGDSRDRRFGLKQDTEPLQNDVQIRRLLGAVLVLSFIGFVGYFLFMYSSGGVRYYVLHIRERALLRTTDYYRLLFQFMQAASLVWFAYDRHALRKVSFWLLVLLNVIGLTTLGAAHPVVLFVAFLIAISLSSRRASRGKLATFWRNSRSALFVLAIVLVLLVGRVAWRQSSTEALSSTSTGLTFNMIGDRAVDIATSDRFSRFVFGGGNLASIEQMSTVVEVVPREVPYLHGQTLYWTLLAPIPRVVWPDKPAVTIGLHLKQRLEDPDAETGAVPASWMGQTYLDFGIGGVILGSLLFGYVSARVLKWYWMHGDRPFVRLLYLNYVLVFTFLLTKAELKTALNRAGGYFLAFWLASLIIERHRPPKRSVQKPSAKLPAGFLAVTDPVD